MALLFDNNVRLHYFCNRTEINTYNYCSQRTKLAFIILINTEHAQLNICRYVFANTVKTSYKCNNAEDSYNSIKSGLIIAFAVI